jgi:YidC/Oxa1 family membrane protein insertase
MVFLFGIIYVVYEPLTHILRLDSATISALTEIVKANTDILGSNAGSSTQVQLAIVSAIQNSETVGLFSSIAPDVIEKIQNFDYTLFGLYLGQVPTWKSVLVLIPILSGLTALATSMVSMKLTPGMDQQQNNSMKYMMYFMPIMSLWIAFSVPCGVGIYWIVSNLLAIVQTVLLNKFYSPAKYKAEYEEQVRKVEEQKKKDREERKKRNGGKKLPEEIEEEKEAEAEAKRKAPATPDAEKAAEAYMTSKELNRKRLAEARKRDAEKYGEEYIEVTDQDLM